MGVHKRRARSGEKVSLTILCCSGKLHAIISLLKDAVMIKPIQNILFATNLSPDCISAFEYAAAIATRFQATLVLLHVVEKMPEYIESRLKGLLGQKKWEETLSVQVSGVREQLIGKKSSNAVIQAALAQFCSDAGIDDNACGYHSREIVVTNGEVIDDIIHSAADYQCDLIVMGTKEGFLSHNSIGSTIKRVMRQAQIPVMVVPPVEGVQNA
jgi:nucleotide-binding universal stress UspA family protein